MEVSETGLPHNSVTLEGIVSIELKRDLETYEG